MPRTLGGTELYFQTAYDNFGAHKVGALYTLSRPITLADLQRCAETLRSHYAILQTTVTKSRKPSFDTCLLSPHVTSMQTDGDVAGAFQKLIDGVYGSAERDRDLVEARRRQAELYLPWTFVLLGDGSCVAFLAPHSICDGVSCDILGGQMVRVLNGGDLGPRLEIAPSIRGLFGREKKRYSFQGMWRLLKAASETIDDGGIVQASKTFPRDWKRRTFVGRAFEARAEDIAGFHEKCRAENISLTCGILSAVYEALASLSPGEQAGRRMTTSLAMDLRKRISHDAMSEKPVGCYAGSCVIPEAIKSGDWSGRARRISDQIGRKERMDFLSEDVMMGQAGRGWMLRMIANGAEGGRLMGIDFSNLGVAKEIEEANREVGDGVRVVKMRFDDGQRALGGLLGVLVVTVEGVVSVGVRSCTPFLTEDRVTEISNNLERFMKES